MDVGHLLHFVGQDRRPGSDEGRDWTGKSINSLEREIRLHSTGRCVSSERMVLPPLDGNMHGIMHGNPQLPRKRREERWVQCVIDRNEQWHGVSDTEV